MRIRVTTRADLFEKRKRQHIERGLRVEERSVPVNGFCTFIAVKDTPISDRLAELVAEALNGSHGMRLVSARCHSRSAFALLESAAFTLVTTRNETDGQEMGSVKAVNLSTSFTFT